MTSRMKPPADVARLPQDIYDHLNRIEGKIDELAETVHNNNVETHAALGKLANQIHQAENRLDSRIDDLDSRMGRIEDKIDDLDDKVDGILSLLNGHQP